MSKEGTELSSALLAAQNRLYLLRQKHLQEREALGLSYPDSSGTAAFFSKEEPSPSIVDVSRSLPEHLGWNSIPLTNIQRTSLQKQISSSRQDAQNLSWLTAMVPERSKPVPASPPQKEKSFIKLHPDIALGMLRKELSAAGRVWLLLRYIDLEGRGWIRTERVRELLTRKQSHLRVCGWRQLRNLLAQGEAIFWQRDKDRVWLRSLVNVAASLEIWNLTGNPVDMPVSILTQGIGSVRAHFYASFHSGRTIKRKTGRPTSMPIARETIKKICHISRRTQRKYERITRVKHQYNFALGPQDKTDNVQETAWRHGRSLFHLIDRKGKQGDQGKTYLAWQLPNNYFGPHTQRPRGQQKRINQKLADLSMQGMTGNGKERVVSDETNLSKRFYGNARLAAKTYNQSIKRNAYWRDPQTSNKRSQFWHFLSK